MRKTIVFAIVLLSTCASVFGQDFPEYGNVSSTDLKLKECAFDKNANAVILLHQAFSGYDDDRHLVTTHHVRIKVLKEKGVSSADVSIPYYRSNEFEQITNVEGMTINAGESGLVEKVPLSRKTIFTKKTNEHIGEVVFAFPAVKVGSIIEYKYVSVMKHYGGLDDWSFQDELPVVSSKYTLIITPNTEFSYRVNKTLEIPMIVKQMPSSGGIYFEMSDIPGLSNEPYIDARRDYLQRVIFQLSGFDRAGSGKTKYMTSWNEVNREMNNRTDFGGQLGKSIDGAEEFLKQTKLLASPEEKMKAVFEYVRANMSWNHMYSKFVTDGVKTAWKNKSGTSGDVNLLLVNLLKEVSLEVYPILVSERFHGKVDVSYPFIDQFNSVFACVVINGRKYYLDATDKSIPPHLTPSDILNTTGFLIKRKDGELVNITNDSAQYKDNIFALVSVAENGSLSGSVSVKSSDYARVEKLSEYVSDKSKFKHQYFIVDGTSITVKDLIVENQEKDSLTLDQKGDITGALNTTGEYFLMPLNLFTGFYHNPFVGDNRFSNINFGYRRTTTLNCSIQLPANLVVDEMPKSVKLSDPDKEILFQRQLQYDKESNTIQCLMMFQFKRSLYEADMYQMIKEMYKKMFDYLKEPVVLKRK